MNFRRHPYHPLSLLLLEIYLSFFSVDDIVFKNEIFDLPDLRIFTYPKSPARLYHIIAKFNIIGITENFLR
jgi:hypothetical protein